MASERAKCPPMSAADIPTERIPDIGERLKDLPGVDPIGSGDGADVLRDAPADPVRFLRTAARLAEIVASIHERGITHRDIRPENLRLRDGDVVLAGFGNAVTFDEQASGFASLDQLPDRPSYISPEQTGRMNRPVDYRTDLYSLGATLHALAVGAPPFTGPDRTALIHAHLARTPHPPHQLAPWLPPVVSAVILRLLAKEPDDRYQSATGLANDLRRLEEALLGARSLGEVTLFAGDRLMQPRMPHRLVGRDHSLHALIAAFEAATSGGLNALFFSGEAGVGKTSLVNELHRPVTLAGGRFVRGKCEQFRREGPLLAPLQAARQLLVLLLSEPEENLGPLRQRLREWLGREAGALCDILPELEALTGRFPPPARLDPPEAQRRLTSLLVRFFGAIASPEQPLVLVLDDLQWADRPTLDLLTALLGDNDLDGMLLVGLFRGDEIDPAHPLGHFLRDAAQHPRAPAAVILDNLEPEMLAALIGDMLGARPGDITDLAEAVRRITGGNPFFAIELVQTLHREGILHYDDGQGRWTWDSAALGTRPSGANVVEFLLRNLSGLPAPEAEALAALACLGADASLGLLARATGQTPRELAARLRPSLERGVLVTAANAAFVRGEEEAVVAFCHDRMQQAAILLINEDRRGELHLQMARRLAGATDAATRFRAAEHYAQSAALLREPSEKDTAIKLFLEAALAARDAGAFDTARRFLRLGLDLLGPDPWSRSPAAAWELHTALHVVCYSRSDYAEADELYATLSERAPEPQRLIEPTCIQVMSLSNRTLYDDAVRLGCGLLSSLGIQVPIDEPQPSFERELLEFYRAANAGALEHLAVSTDAAAGAASATKLVNRMVPAAFFTRPVLADWLVVHTARQWLEGRYEHARLYPMACMLLATVPAREDYDTGYRAARAALSAAESVERSVETARVRHVFALFNCHWFEPLEHGLTQARDAHEALQRTGELEFACYTYFTSQAAVLDTASNLDDLAAENRRALAFAAKTGNRHARQSYAAYAGLLADLTGDQVADAGNSADPAGNPMAACFHHIHRALAACLLGGDDDLVHHAGEAQRLTPYITGFYPVALARVLDSFALLVRLRRGEPDPALDARFGDNLRWLAARAADAPFNFVHLHDLLEAEHLAATGRAAGALPVFERAVRRAVSHRRPWHAALATERAARCYLSLDLEQAGHRLLEQARDRYMRWGAARKVAALEDEFPFLKGSGQAAGDVAAFLDATRKLAALRTVPELAAATADIVGRMTGATDVQIVALDQNDTWILKGGFSTDGPLTRRSLAQAENEALVPGSVVRLGLRLGQSVLSDDAVTDVRFASDPYFRVMERCSLLAVPVIAQNRPVSLVIAANRRLRGVFVPGLARTVELFCSHLAIALENTRIRKHLEAQVEERTRELRAAERTLAQTAYELTENIPVGTYVLEFDAAGNPRFTFVSERWLRMLNLSREEVLADHSLAVRAVHPDEREDFDRLNARAFAAKERFYWEGRIVVRGETRWVTIESIPRDRPGGGTIWEGVMTDITARKKAEEEQKRIFDNLPIAVCATTLESPAAITFLNDQFVRTFGYTVEDIPTVADWARRAYPDEDYRTESFRVWDAAVERAIAIKGSVESMEFRVACKDHTTRDILIGAVVLDDRLLVAFTDITERKRAEEELRRVREELQRTAYELTENIPVGTYTMVQPPGGGMACFSFMSARFLEMTGLDREAARENPMNAFACVHPDDQGEWVKENTHAFEHKLPFKEECRVIVEGETRWITAESTPRDRPDGSVVWEGVLTDITDRKLAEQKLAESEARLRRILDNIPIPVAINNNAEDGRITFLNTTFIRTFGYTLEDIPTVADWAQRAYPDADYRTATFRVWDAAVARAVETKGSVEPLEFRVRSKDGSPRQVLINAVVLEDMLLVGFIDITERKRNEDREKQLEAQHRRDLESKLRTSLSASAIAHEINQPLSAILLQSNMALRQGIDQRKALEVITAEAQRVVTTIEKMKTLLRNVQTEHKPVDLAQVVKSSLLYTKGQIARAGITVRQTGLRKVCRIEGDDAQLQLAAVNLLRNAVEAITESGADRKEICIALDVRGKEAELVIGDSGPGWTGAELEKIPLTTTKKEGTGIGLYVVRTAVQNHGGTIEFGKSPFGGAEVRLRFPRIG